MGRGAWLEREGGGESRPHLSGKAERHGEEAVVAEAGSVEGRETSGVESGAAESVADEGEEEDEEGDKGGGEDEGGEGDGEDVEVGANGVSGGAERGGAEDPGEGQNTVPHGGLHRRSYRRRPTIAPHGARSQQSPPIFLFRSEAAGNQSRRSTGPGRRRLGISVIKSLRLDGSGLEGASPVAVELGRGRCHQTPFRSSPVRGGPPRPHTTHADRSQLTAPFVSARQTAEKSTG